MQHRLMLYASNKKRPGLDSSWVENLRATWRAGNPRAKSFFAFLEEETVAFGGEPGESRCGILDHIDFPTEEQKLAFLLKWG